MKVAFYGTLNERTGYGIHATNFVRGLSKLTPVDVNGEGDVYISLYDTVTASNITTRHPKPSILYNVWESTRQPDNFIDKLSLYDQMWVPSEWQRQCTINQGISEDFVKVVPEGIDPDIYKPAEYSPLVKGDTFYFVHVGQWQPRKSTKEICEAFIKAFPDNPNVRLYISADTLFPSDNYKSTEERLEGFGINDPRIIPVHFEERDVYIRRLQQADCFVTCARSEGWNLPLCEAMACGIPAIASDFGGSTEYTKDALLVRIKELKKPEGIYGEWDVPGLWGEPDYEHLVELMREVYENHEEYKEKALRASEVVRKDFSWEAAANKAFNLISELYQEHLETHQSKKQIAPRNAIFSIDCHPSSQERLDTLMETIRQVKQYGYPVLVTSHLPIPPSAMEECDYFIYDKKDILSGDDLPVYSRVGADGKIEYTKASIPCHALAGHHNVRNAIDFCLGRFEWMYHMNSDVEVDLDEWLRLVQESDKDVIAVPWEKQPETFGGQIVAGKTELLDKLYGRFETWAEYANFMGKDRFCSEKGYYKVAASEIGVENIELLSIELGNRHDQVDRDAWDDDVFRCHFVEGAHLYIEGLSRREYDVEFRSDDGVVFATKQKPGMQSSPSIKYYKGWTVTARLDGEVKYEHKLDLDGKKVLVSLGSKALGDTIAWMPYVEEFRQKHGCHVLCSGWNLEMFDYPEIEFVKPGSEVRDIYATYMVGCYDNQLDKNVTNWRETNLQKVAADILGLEFKPLRAKLKIPPAKRGNGVSAKKSVCFSEFSTMKAKQWNRDGAWQNIVDYLNKQGYECISISKESSNLNGVTKHNGQSLIDTIGDINECEFYIGLNHGPSWIAYALDKPVIMITGIAEDWNDFYTPYRIHLGVCKPACFNDTSIPIDRGWDWCPNNKNYECTRNITEDMVIEKIEEIRNANKNKEEGQEVPSIDTQWGEGEGYNEEKGRSPEAIA